MVKNQENMPKENKRLRLRNAYELGLLAGESQNFIDAKDAPDIKIDTGDLLLMAKDDLEKIRKRFRFFSVEFPPIEDFDSIDEASTAFEVINRVIRDKLFVYLTWEEITFFELGKRVMFVLEGTHLGDELLTRLRREIESYMKELKIPHSDVKKVIDGLSSDDFQTQREAAIHIQRSIEKSKGIKLDSVGITIGPFPSIEFRASRK